LSHVRLSCWTAGGRIISMLSYRRLLDYWMDWINEPPECVDKQRMHTIAYH
jgi:hypothetical protein